MKLGFHNLIDPSRNRTFFTNVSINVYILYDVNLWNINPRQRSCKLVTKNVVFHLLNHFVLILFLYIENLRRQKVYS